MALRDILIKMGVQVDQRPLQEVQRTANGVIVRFKQLQRIAGFALAALGGGQLIESADELIGYQNRLKAVTNSLEEYKAAEEGVIEVSRRSLTSVKDQAAIYQRYAQVTDNLNLSQDELLQFTESVTKAMKLGGGSTAEVRGALIQLGQGIGTDFKAGGQELNSILEQAPNLAKILAKAAGGTRGELKQLARDGKLSGKVVVKAVMDATAKIDADFEKRQKTFGDMATLLETEWLMLMKQLLPVITGVIERIGAAIEWTRGWIERGEALNSVIAAATVAVIGLTVAFGPLLAQLMLAAAPWVALFAVIEDFVGFMRGHKSIIGKLFFDDDKGKIDAARDEIKIIWDYLKGFFDFLKNPSNLGSTFKMIFRELGSEADRFMAEFLKGWNFFMLDVASVLRSTLGDGLSDLLGIATKDEIYAPRNRKKAAKKGSFFEDSVVRNSEYLEQGFDKIDFWEDIKKTALSTLTAIHPAAGALANLNMLPGKITDTQLKGSSSANITNNITVQGNADADTARTIARETAKETAATLNRDKSAIGGALGL